MKVLVCGSRNFTDHRRMDAVLGRYKIDTLIEGCARGADELAEEWALIEGVPVNHHPAQWAEHGRSAGAIRNNQMLDDKPDLVIAFYRDRLNPSPGTQNMVDQAMRAGVPVVLA